MIKKIQYKNDKILKDLSLDFTKPDGTPYSTIILAGENGTGKTSIFNTLSTFLSFGSFEPFDSICYTDKDKHNITLRRSGDESDNKEGSPFIIVTGKAAYKGINNSERIKNNPEDLRYYGCIYSKAKTGYHTSKVTSVTTRQLDQNNLDIDNSEDYTDIKQLLIDIDTIDNSSWRRISEQTHTHISIDEFNKSCGLSRFRNAFNNFFENLRFDYIDNQTATEKNIFFTKNGININIDQLSSGEKQIIFRGTQLLRNSRKLENGIVLIDEPELSLHPKWQLKILNYYRDLFKDGTGKQTAQLFIATHSEFLIRSAVNDPDVLIIVLTEDNGNKIARKVESTSFLLNPTTSAEVNYEAFSVVTPEYHIQLYGKIQIDNSITAIKATDDFILHHPKYDSTKYERIDNFTPPPRPGSTPHTTTYNTLPTYIRNRIDHPRSSDTYTDEELKKSIEFLRDVLTP